MNRRFGNSMRIVLLMGLALLAGLAHATPASARTETSNVDSSVSARAFCEQRGGTVAETGDRDVYVCCYTQKQKCLVSNTRLNQSVLVDLPWDAKGL